MIDLYSSSANLGDNLGMTALARITPVRVHLYDDPAVRSIAPIFDGLCEVAFDNGSPQLGPPRSSDPGHFPGPTTSRFLEWAGYTVGMPGSPSAIPHVRLTHPEIAGALRFLRDYPRDLCAIKSSPQELNQRTPPAGLMARIVAANPGVTFLNFGLSRQHVKSGTAHPSIPGVADIFDLPIRQQAAIYAVIGRYIGPDTGDYHLMLAVGGQCDVLVPLSSPTYSHQHFHYNGGCWAGQDIRCRYHDWSKSDCVIHLNPADQA